LKIDEASRGISRFLDILPNLTEIEASTDFDGTLPRHAAWQKITSLTLLDIDDEFDPDGSDSDGTHGREDGGIESKPGLDRKLYPPQLKTFVVKNTQTSTSSEQLMALGRIA
jgi:hypothetical protein